MKTFKEYINEGKIPTVKSVRKILNSVDFENIYSEFFDIEKKNTDAGIGGYDYIQITFDEKLAQSPKRKDDVTKGIDAITSNFKNADVSKLNQGLIIIR